MTRRRRLLLACLLALPLQVCAQQPGAAKHYMVVTSHPLAVEAGVRMLDRGGGAIDAMIATLLMLNLVEPGAAGLGGGAYLLYYDARAKSLRALDGRETAPAGAAPSMFLNPDGKPMAFPQARGTGLAVGAPGTPRLLEVAHARYGKLPWKDLFRPAIERAERGFPVSERLHRQLGREAVQFDAAARALFFGSDGKPKPAGTVIRNPAFAATLRTLAEHGADAFYKGAIAGDIVTAVRTHPVRPGTLSLEDLAGYRVRDAEPVCGGYRAWTVCGMPPSSSGGVAVVQIMGALEGFDLPNVRPGSAEAVHLKAEAERLAFADRAKYLGDDRFVDVPTKALVDRAYIASRAQLIAREKSMGKASPGTPPGVKMAFAEDSHEEAAGTSHISIVDRGGNAVSMTATIESVFGNGTLVRGFLLNNELTDFSSQPAEGSAELANAVAGGKRPRSSMSPTVVFDRASGALELLAGSSGGSFIIGHVTKALIATLDWKMDPQKAVDLPNFGNRNGPTEIEQGTELEGLQASLKAMGHEVRVLPMTSGLQVIRRSRAGWEGGSDPRREGAVGGR